MEEPAKQIEDGGPAFPLPLGTERVRRYQPGYGDYISNVGVSECGLTIRDYFAAKAMQAIVAQHRLNSCGDFVAGDGLLQHYKAPEYAAKTAYQFADAMLAARKS